MWLHVHVARLLLSDSEKTHHNAHQGGTCSTVEVVRSTPFSSYLVQEVLHIVQTEHNNHDGYIIQTTNVLTPLKV